MVSVTPVSTLMFVGSIVGQVAGVALLPKTDGLTQPMYTAFCAICFAVGIGFLARLSYAGVQLGILIPLISATLPLASIALGIFAYGEIFSPLKVSLLLGACAAIGVAASLH